MNVGRQVLFDTNFFLIPYYYKLDIFAAVASLLPNLRKIIVPSTVIDELKALSKKKSKEGLAARFALKVIEVRDKEIEIVQTALPPDVWFVKFVEREDGIVCTNDKELKKRIKKFGRNVILLRAKSKISLE